MTSKIVVNNIQADAGVSTVTFSSNIQGNLIGNVTGTVNSSGIATFSSGLVVSAGSTSAPSISPSGDSNTGIFFPSVDTIAFAEGGVEGFRLDSSGRLGIGTASVSAQLHVYKSGDGQTPAIFQTGNTNGLLYFYNDSNGWSLDSGGDIRFITSRTGSGEPIRMKIDSSGRVTTPYQPTFVAYLSSNYSYTGSGARLAVPFNATSTNIGSHFNTSTNRFIAPVAGTYIFTASLVCNSGSSSTYFSCDIFVNGAGIPGSSGWLNMASGYQIQRNSLITYLSVNDYVDVRMEKSANDTITGGVTFSGFTGTLLG